jgi:hypothetical protein
VEEILLLNLKVTLLALRLIVDKYSIIIEWTEFLSVLYNDGKFIIKTKKEFGTYKIFRELKN